MEVAYTPRAKADIEYWKNTGNQKVMNKISALVDAIIENPFSGIGKPVPLKFRLQGSWSRRINHVDRLVYELIDGRILIHSAKGHYK